jgi:hypothetical protein
LILNQQTTSFLDKEMVELRWTSFMTKKGLVCYKWFCEQIGGTVKPLPRAQVLVTDQLKA